MGLSRMIARGVFALLWFYLIVVTGHAETISGPAQLLDGDTLRIEGVRIRLNGIDAPETDQTCLDRKGHRWACGIEARDALSRFIAGRSVSCAVSGADVYGRKLATCSAGGENLNVRLVREGRALAYRKYSLQYVADEEAAHAAGRGLWGGAFIAPWDWRHRGPGTTVLMGNAAGTVRPENVFAPRQRPPDAACVIKGNVNRRGERIYHMPGQRDYGRVNMASSSQKRWFCTEEEAQAAGWRKALR